MQSFSMRSKHGRITSIRRTVTSKLKSPSRSTARTRPCSCSSKNRSRELYNSPSSMWNVYTARTGGFALSWTTPAWGCRKVRIPCVLDGSRMYLDGSRLTSPTLELLERAKTCRRFSWWRHEEASEVTRVGLRSKLLTQIRSKEEDWSKR